MKVELAFQAKDILGEGPVWAGEEQALYWVDILRPALQRWQPASGQHTLWPMPSPIGSFALRQGGGAVIALQSGLAFFDFGDESITPIANPEAHLPRTRFNDGKCDRQGRFWVGSMDNRGETDPIAALYRLDPDGCCHHIRGQVTVSNGLGWSPDNRTMYYTDSPTRNIFAYDFEPETGAISRQRIFAHDTGCFPDGLTVDAEGRVWSAKWDGGKVVCYAPSGAIEREIAMPVRRPTSCMFGGPELRQLYITSARVDLSGKNAARQLPAGGVFVLETDAPGLPEPKFAG
jgi:sugar lactone lactonase YvrE